MEVGVEHVRSVPDMQASSFGAVKEPDREDAIAYTAGDFLKQTGAVVAVCLGLGLLAQALVALVGIY
jgi:hypothetical protein